LATTVEKLAHFGFECSFIDDENTLMWRKLVFLAPLALSTTAANAPIGQIISDPPQMIELRELVLEACAVAVASGAKVDANVLLEVIKSVPAEMRSSMQKDVEQGKSPESRRHRWADPTRRRKLCDLGSHNETSCATD